MPVRLVMFGDIVGRPGRLAVAQLIPQVRERWKPDLVLANAENAASGSGLTPELYRKLRAAGIDAMTLGDHCFRKVQIVETLEREPDIIRPVNLASGAKGKGWMRLPLPAGSDGAGRSLFVITVLGRLFMNVLADDPFAAIERVLRELPEKDPLVLVEVHAEATSEKQAIGWQFNGRVAVVVGTHTHVRTADARVLYGPGGGSLGGGTAFISDLGMCGPMESVLGREIDRVLTHMITGMPAPFDVAEGDPRACGAFIEIDERTGRALQIEGFELKADPAAPPFTAA